MFQNYLKIAIRNLWKDKAFSFINISGLAIGLASVMLITLYSWDEINYDSIYPGTDNVYKIELSMQRGGRPPRAMPNTGGAIAPTLASELSDLVQTAARISNDPRMVTVNGESQSLQVGQADPTIFDLFKVPFVAGNSVDPLKDPSSVVINETIAKNLFRDKSPVGEIIDLDNGKSYKVTAVMKDLPQNTHLDLSIVFANQTGPYDLVDQQSGWWSIFTSSYIRLQDGKSIEELRTKAQGIIDKYVQPSDPAKKSSDEYGLTFIPLKDVHFETSANDRGDRTLLIGFITIAAVILAIATFNFMNMALSRTIVRAREVAIRKSVGATRKDIIHQFLGEAVVTTIIALIIALIVTEISLPVFNQFVSKLMSSGTLASPMFMGGIVALIAIVGLGSGYYPASIMAAFNPAEVLRGGRANSKNISLFRTVLVTAQFSVAIGLIIAASVVYGQINYSQSMDPGYNKENLLVIHDIQHPDVIGVRETLLKRMSENPDVVSASLSDNFPGNGFGWITELQTINSEPVTSMSLRGQIIDANFIPTMEMTIVAGRNFNADLDSDYNRRNGGDYKESNILINETAVRTLGFGTPEEAIGKTINDGSVKTIVGVVKDFMIRSSKSTIPAMHYLMDEQEPRELIIRFNSNNLPALLTFVDDTWKSLVPNRPIRKDFLDERLARQYNLEKHQGDIFAIFASLAVLVSCIGLYGLASLTIERRTKEVGLRKVMGAGVMTIVKQIVWDFSKPVLLANVIAWPLAFYFMSGWLEKFVYRVELNAMPFLMAGTLAVLIAWITVGSHAIRVARTNPIKALRYE
jgi:putative ABC transport system permease protein